MTGLTEKKQSIALWTTHCIIITTGCLYLWLNYEVNATICLFYYGAFISLFSLFSFTQLLTKPFYSVWLYKSVYFFAIALLAIIASIHIDNAHSYGPLIADSVNAIFQTEYIELTDYLIDYVSQEILFFALIWTLLLALSIIFLPQTTKVSFPFRLFGLPILLIGALLISLNNQDAMLIYKEMKSYSETLSSFNESRIDILSKNNLTDLQSDFEGTVIIVMGESTSRHHLGIYNYVRDTTPNLSRRRNNLFLFSDIISTHSHTVPSLTDALTLNDRLKHISPNNAVDLITLFKKLGFYTAWLSNQNAIGIWDDPVAAIARQADYVKYHDPSSGTKRIRAVYDDALIESLREIILKNKSKKRLIFLHLMAPHFPYCNVVPEDFISRQAGYNNIKVDAAFLGSPYLQNYAANKMEFLTGLLNSINCYDIAVRYVDHVLNEIINLADTIDAPTQLLYLADHGEAPIIGSAHESRTHSHFHVEIPFILWANQVFKNTNKDKIEAIQKNINKPGSLVDFSYSIADLVNTKGIPGIEERSIFSKNYRPFNRTTLHRKINYDTFDKNADYVERSRGNLNEIRSKWGAEALSKVWAHRVDSIASFMEAKDIFPGIELDVVFQKQIKKFFVYHPPASNPGLTLEKYLRQDDGKKHYWFDWKNVEKDNIEAAISNLSTLDEKYTIKKRVIVETGVSISDVSKISQQGWQLSYYLPTHEILNCIKSCSHSEAGKLAATIMKRVGNHSFSAISFDARLLPFFNSHLDKFIENNKLKVFIWDQSIDISSEKAPQRLEPYLTHRLIDVVLVDFPSLFDL